MHLNEDLNLFKCICYRGLSFMKYYNRDNYERNLESYEVPEYFSKGSRNVFVYGFIVGAVIGSATTSIATFDH